MRPPRGSTHHLSELISALGVRATGGLICRACPQSIGDLVQIADKAPEDEIVDVFAVDRNACNRQRAD